MESCNRRCSRHRLRDLNGHERYDCHEGDRSAKGEHELNLNRNHNQRLEQRHIRKMQQVLEQRHIRNQQLDEREPSFR